MYFIVSKKDNGKIEHVSHLPSMKTPSPHS